MPSYTQPQTFETGQVVGRAQLDILRDNDEFWHGMAYRWQPVLNTMSSDPLAGQTTLTAWSGYIWIASDAQRFWYEYTAQGGSASITTYLTLYQGDGTTAVGSGNIKQAAVGTGAAVTYNAGTTGVDLASTLGTTISAGLYCLKLRCAKDTNDDTMTLRFTYPPHMSYTGSLTYTSPPTVTDGNVSSAGHFNAWRNNDVYFATNSPRQPAFAGNDVDAKVATTTIFDGYRLHFGSRLYYSVAFKQNIAGEKLKIIYDYGGTGEQTLLETGTTGTHTSYATITGTHTWGTWKRVIVQLLNGGDGTVNYLYAHPQIGDEDSTDPKTYTIMEEFSVDQYLFGSSTGSSNRLQLFSDNDRHIFKYLCTSAYVGRRDFATRSPSYTNLAGTDSGEFRLVRRYDTLYYRTAGGILEWGDDQSQSLTDYTTTDHYQTLDLAGLTGLHYGTVYKITGSELLYAAEMP